MGATDTRPLIAVTTSEVRTAEAVSPTPHGERPQHEMALGLTYLRALERAGALPVVVPPLSVELVEPLLDRFDGLCMSGGPDLDPGAYGERRHARTGPVEIELDVFELALARAADARGMPILAICRGMQVLNVARGGSLHQHLPDVVGEGINHRQSEAGARLTHWVSLDPATRLAATLDRRRVKVNSFHHQGVARLGHDLAVVGRASDATIEGIEATDREFVVGVQWHAESLVARPEQAALFAAFVDCARGPRADATHLRAA
ncbi:MAG TPA: gamma-glutamyl-gamma-aminobutyrate hydrolase family protein [Solirubrobacteraceae bacterium]|jgi:putative glutamine amidotransferase